MDTLLKLAIVLLVAVVLVALIATAVTFFAPVSDLASDGMDAVNATTTFAGSSVRGNPRDVFDYSIALLPAGSLVALGSVLGGLIALFLAFLVGRWLYKLVVQS